jgi:hypothetical protein
MAVQITSQTFNQSRYDSRGSGSIESHEAAIERFEQAVFRVHMILVEVLGLLAAELLFALIAGFVLALRK